MQKLSKLINLGLVINLQCLMRLSQCKFKIFFFLGKIKVDYLDSFHSKGGLTEYDALLGVQLYTIISIL